MSTKVVDAKLLSKMFLTGAKNLENNKEWINELNVFPVPDGDTGTNMTMTIMSAAKEVVALENVNEVTMEALCKAISSGSLKGARGNSGVILSQLLRGFTKSVKTCEKIEIPQFADAFEKAVETAYKAVMKPKEGTILTVAKYAADKARERADAGETDLDAYFRAIIDEAEVALAKTPEMLPVLKQAGVVDSGGQGLVQVLKGAYDAFCGKAVDIATYFDEDTKTVTKDSQSAEDIKFGYCTEFIIMPEKTFNIKHEMDFKTFLETIGESIVLVADEEIVKVHVHTNDPGLAIQRALKYGQLSNIKIDNMRLEHEEKLIKDSEKASAKHKAPAPAEPPKNYGFIAVSAGEGLSEIFKGLGVDEIIEGGQTMNPSTEDMVDAVARINAKTVFILPNNKNIIMAANQAEYLVEDKKVVVIPTKTIPQGISALINFMPDNDAQTNAETMKEALDAVKTGQVTYAVRDTMIDDKEIKEGDYMGIGDKGLLSVNPEMIPCVDEMIGEMLKAGDSELLTVYYGAEVSEDEAGKIADIVNEKYPSVDVEVQYGGQPIYYYIISAE